MSKIKIYASCVLGLAATLCLSACTTTRADSGGGVASQSGAVVLLDPSVDDSMLPMIGESLSAGRVTIYPLEGPVPSSGVSAVMAGPHVMPPGAGLVPPPIGAMPKSTDDVIVYSLDTGAPLAGKAPQIAPVRATKLSSPFNGEGKVAAKVPAKKKKTESMAPSTGRPKSGMTF